MTERRQNPLTQEQLAELAKLLAPLLAPMVREELESNFFKAVGKTVIERFLGALGIIALGLMAYLTASGHIKW